MKILVIGDFQYSIYEEAFFNAWKKLGHEVLSFSWAKYFLGIDFGVSSRFKKLWLKLQNRYCFGSAIQKINSDLADYIENTKIDFIFVYRGRYLLPQTIKKIKQKKIKLAIYNNDDPFSKDYPIFYWRLFHRCLKLYDFVFAYRPKNVIDYKKRNIDKVFLLPPYYIASQNFPINLAEQNKYSCDVSFIGHYEPDGRDEYIRKILEDKINLKVFGDGWSKSKHYHYFIDTLKEIKPIRDPQQYNLAINSSKISLVFLSKRNNDTYTRRCFEIPAAKGFMLSIYTSDLAQIFSPKVEAEYFNDPNEAIEKIRYYLTNDNLRKKIAHQGYEKLLNGQHEIFDKAKQVLEVLIEK